MIDKQNNPAPFPGVQEAIPSSVPSVAVADAAGKTNAASATEKSPKRRLPRPWSIFKMGLGVAFIAISVIAITLEGGTVSSNNAVVSAYKISARTPIEGIVSGIGTKVGDVLNEGQIIGRVNEVRVSDERLVDLRENVVRLKEERSAYEIQVGELGTLRQELSTRISAYAQASREHMTLMLKEAVDIEAAKRTRFDVAQREAARRIRLSNAGYASTSETDKFSGEAEALAKETTAGSFHVGALRAQVSAAEQGTLTDSGSSDKIYSQQRDDEVVIHLAELKRTITSLKAQENEAAARLSEEEARIARYRTAELRAPTQGIVWKLSVGNGERLSIADPVMELVNCNDAFIIAVVPQDRFGDVQIGAQANYRLSGETVDRTGTVQSIVGQGTLADERNLAAAPMVQRSAVAMARVSLDAAGLARSDCSVGRTLRILLPVRRRGFLEFAQHWFE